MVSRRAAPVNFASIGSNQILGSGGGSRTEIAGSAKNDAYVNSYQSQQDAIFLAKYGY